MAIGFDCPECDKRMWVPDDLAGMKGRCPGCGAFVPIPNPANDAPAKPPAPRSDGTAHVCTFMCPDCDQLLTIPFQRGKIDVSCPGCGATVSVLDGRVTTRDAAPAESTKTWYLALPGGQKHGPLRETTLLRWVDEGGVPPGSNVWSMGMGNWQPCERTLPFSLHLRARPSAPVQARTSPRDARKNALYPVVSLTLGLIGLVPFLGLVFGPAAIVFGALSANASKTRPGDRGIALAGVIAGTVAVGIGIFSLIFLREWLPAW